MEKKQKKSPQQSLLQKKKKAAIKELFYISNYGTNHPQLKRYMCVCHMCKTKKCAWHQTTCVHVCKIDT